MGEQNREQGIPKTPGAPPDGLKDAKKPDAKAKPGEKPKLEDVEDDTMPGAGSSGIGQKPQ
jgi:hypothetical protein